MGTAKSIDIITGGAGFIGSHIVDRILETTNHHVRVIDNFSNGHERNLEQHQNNERLEIINSDIGDYQALAGTFSGASRVFHMAALADIVPSINHPEAYFKANVDGTFNILQYAKAAGVQKFVYAASSSCYGIPDTYPTPETAEIRPQYPYALTKRLGEELVMHWAQVYKMPCISLRLFNVYGPRARTSGTYGAVFGVFLAQILADKPVTIVGDGTQTRDFTYVSDIVSAFIMAASSEKTGQIYNVGSDGTYSINELVKNLGVSETQYIPKRPGEPDITHADISKIQNELGWKATVPFDEGCKRMLDNIKYWENAPVWTPEKIADATKDWFKYLS